MSMIKTNKLTNESFSFLCFYLWI